MARVETVTHVEAPPERVWGTLVDWELPPAWLTEGRTLSVDVAVHGVGTEVRRTSTLAFGLKVHDRMVLTDWEPERLLGIRHDGSALRGVGALELTPTPHGTRVEWWEEVETPFGALGETLATVFAVPWARRGLRKRLAGLKRQAECSYPDASRD